MIEALIAWSTRNRFLVLTGTAGALLWGLFSLKNIPLDAIPDLSDVQVIVLTEWQGRSPDLVEDQITYPIVTSMLGAPRVKFVRGQSFFGLSFVYIIFEDGTDMYWARSRVLEYLNQARGGLPKDVTPSLGADATGVGWAFQYALVDKTGENSLQEIRSFQDWYLKYWLQAIPGVAEVATVGGHVKQYQVVVDPEALVARKIPLKKVIEAIRRSNNDVGGRLVEMSETEYMVRGRGYITQKSDLETVPLGLGPGGTPILLRDVAHIQIGPDIRRGLAELDGEGQVVGGIVVVRYGEDVLGVLDRVKSRLKELEKSLPPGVEFVTTYDRSILIRAAISTLREKLIEECLIVLLVCALFLWHLRSSLVAIIMLPAAVVMGFIPMAHMNLTANIMSLGGIAIAIGAMVDAAIVMIENAHKSLESGKGDRKSLLLKAMQQTGRPIFFALLVITVSFLPVFTLEAQAGRLFKPLAFTKTFSMFFAAILSVTLVPVLMDLLIRGHITPEKKQPISRFLKKLYGPVLDWVLRRRKTVLGLAGLLMLSTVYPISKLGSEFMPPLNEGSILYMPTALPGMSITEAAEVLQRQNSIIKSIPEVDHVFGKAGRARTATDPAPLSMVETTITLKPKSQWRRGLTWEGLIAEMDEKLKFPGMPNIWWMPIQTRIEMLATGIRSPVGIKILGPDLDEIARIGKEIERLLQSVSGSRSVFAERVTGGYFIDFEIRREDAARYGLGVEDVEEMIQTGIGGMTIDTTVEGRERYPINVRYPSELRNNLEALKKVLVSTPTGQAVPIMELADIRVTQGPPSIRDENGSLAGFVFADVEGRDLGGFVKEAQRVLGKRLDLPPGYTLVWAGQYQYLEKARKKFWGLILPITLFIVFFLIYLNTKSVAETSIVLLAVPFSLIGAFWLLYFLGYNTSVAVSVGMIALAGLDAETGVVMLLYLKLSYQRFRDQGRLKTTSDLVLSIEEGAVQRIRPKMMTVAALFFGLLPILWSTGAGADVMKRIAVPMVGGIFTSAILELLIYPIIFFYWKRREPQE